MGWSLRLVWWMEGDPGTGQAGMEGNESDIGWLESKVSVGFWEQAQEAAGNAGFTEMELEGQRGCFCQRSHSWGGATPASQHGSVAL